jgi:proteasome lid subunit RPN8/RPN11
MRCIIKLRDLALEEIIRSAWETLKIESDGILFGKLIVNGHKRIFDVFSVHPFQLAERYPNGVYLQDGSERAGHYFFNSVVGEFHSHPTSRKQRKGVRKTDPGRVYLGKEKDLPQLKKTPEQIEMVIAWRKTNRDYSLTHNPYKLSFYLEDNKRFYRFDIGGYHLVGNRHLKAEMVVSKRFEKLLWW